MLHGRQLNTGSPYITLVQIEKVIFLWISTRDSHTCVTDYQSFLQMTKDDCISDPDGHHACTHKAKNTVKDPTTSGCS